MSNLNSIPTQIVIDPEIQTMRLITCGSILALMGGQVLAQHDSGSDSRCFSSHIGNKANFEACCDRTTSGTGDVDGTSFDYACSSYPQHSNEFTKGNFENLYACAKQCADTPQCATAVWNSDLSRCWYTTDAHPEQVTSREPSSYITIKNKRPTMNQPRSESTDCRDPVDEATVRCQKTERQKCHEQIENQTQRLRDECAQSWTEKCNQQKAQLLNQYKEDLVAKDEEHRRNVQKMQDEIDRLKSQPKNLAPDESGGGTRTSKGQSPKSSATPRLEIPSEERFRCPEFDGKEYTVWGVRYKVFCKSRPKGRILGKALESKDLKFLMAMCSAEPNCQGIRTKTSTAEMVLEHEYPPTGKSSYSDWWSIVPVDKKSDSSAIVPDLFSQSSARTGSSAAVDAAKCPSIDGQLLEVGGDEFQINCDRQYVPKRSYPTDRARSFRQCLVGCAILEKCQGVLYMDVCQFIMEHDVLERKTSTKKLSSNSGPYVAMLSVPRNL